MRSPVRLRECLRQRRCDRPFLNGKKAIEEAVAEDVQQIAFRRIGSEKVSDVVLRNQQDLARKAAARARVPDGPLIVLETFKEIETDAR